MQGYVYALAAYGIWGLVLPIFLWSLSGVHLGEVVAHRILWALPFAAAILAWQGGIIPLWRALTWRIAGLALLCAVVISINWTVYVYAIATGHGVDAAFGYYINPLVSLLFGVFLLGERLNAQQIVAIALAACGVAVMAIEAGGLPWVSLVLAGSFALYGLLRKTTPYGAAEGFFLEIVILFMPALAAAIWLTAAGQTQFGIMPKETLLLVAAGPLTAIPLILYAAGARLLRLSTIGILQYITPSLIALTAVFVFGEPFGVMQGIAFAFIWAGLVVYTLSLITQGRRRRARV